MTQQQPPVTNVPARHRAMLIPAAGDPEFLDLGPTEEAPERLTSNSRYWTYAGCNDGIAVYSEETP